MMRTSENRRVLRLMMATASIALLAACEDGWDFDLRDLGNGFDTSAAVENLPSRPDPDNRGVISYPNYQVVVAREGDTPAAIANRLGLAGGVLASYNGVDVNSALRPGEILALPSRVSEPSAATGATSTGPIQPGTVDVSTLAGNAIDRADTSTSTLPPAQSAPVIPEGTEPIRHQVLRGETVFSIARLYGVTPRAISQWNTLGADLTVREGQYLLIPDVTAAVAPAAPAPAAQETAAPGTGSDTPVPPSASTPLPEVDPGADLPTAQAPAVPTPAPNLGADQAPDTTAQMVMPAQGSIIRAYAPGRNDGIDIGAPAGAPVVAADAGTVAAITTDTAGIQIVVIRHADNVLTVYTHLENLTIERGNSVTRGQAIGSVRPGDPSYLHFEVRRGTESEDPTDYLP